ncbi:unnamed protein product, partial [Meganyctiphanes norvegica]
MKLVQLTPRGFGYQDLIRAAGNTRMEKHNLKTVKQSCVGSGEIARLRYQRVEESLSYPVSTSFQLMGAPLSIIGPRMFMSLGDADVWLPFIVLHIEIMHASMQIICGLLLDLFMSLLIRKSGLYGIPVRESQVHPLAAKKWLSQYLYAHRNIFLMNDLLIEIGWLEKECIYEPLWQSLRCIQSLLLRVLSLTYRAHSVALMSSGIIVSYLFDSNDSISFLQYGIVYWWVNRSGKSLVISVTNVICNKGGPFDLMNGRVMCAASSELAKEVAKNLKQYECLRDD